MSRSGEKKTGTGGAKLFYVGIIGSCGRTAAEQKVASPLLWKRMLARAKFVIGSVWKLPLDSIVLVAGGSAWSDHVAVALFLAQQRDHAESPDTWPAFAGLELYLPTPLEEDGFRKTTATGKRLNGLHHAFASTSQYDSLQDWKQLPKSAFRLCTPPNNFLARNRALAQRCTHLLAFPSSLALEESVHTGTSYTWQQCSTNVDKVYVPWPWLLDKTKSTAYVRVFANERNASKEHHRETTSEHSRETTSEHHRGTTSDHNRETTSSGDNEMRNMTSRSSGKETAPSSSRNEAKRVGENDASLSASGSYTPPSTGTVLSLNRKLPFVTKKIDKPKTRK